MITIAENDPWLPRLSEFIDGELTAPEAHELSAHMHGCAACQGTLEQLQGVVSRLEADAQTQHEMAPSNEVWARINRRLVQQPTVPSAEPDWLMSSWPQRVIIGGLLFLTGLLLGWWGANAFSKKSLRWKENLLPGTGAVWMAPARELANTIIYSSHSS